MSHHCHARGCEVKTPPELLMCKRHWSWVPRSLQRRVWATYRPGQCDDKRPLKEWHEAADAAIKFVFELEYKNVRKDTTAENTAKGEKTMNTTQITISFQGAPTPQQIAAQLRFQAGLLEGMEPKAAASRKNTDGAVKTQAASTATTEVEGDDEDFGGKSEKTTSKKTAGKKAAPAAAASFDDEESEETEAQEAEAEETTESEDDGDFMDAAPAAKGKAKKVTVNEVNDACKAKAKASDRKTVLSILKKKFNVTSVTELDQKQYADVIKAMAV